MTHPESFWKDRRVFVTGGTGFLGTWLVDSLTRSGAEVCVLVRDWAPQSPFFAEGLYERVKVVRGELEDYRCLERAINECEAEVVFHLAAQAIVGVANKNPIATFRANIEGTWNLLEACRLTGGQQRIVVASSDKAYGDHAVLPYDEAFALQGRHPYDVSKSCADLISLTYAHTYGLPVSITRCGNLFGPGDMNFSRIVPGTIRSILNGERPLIRSDGSPMRDYVHVQDIVGAYRLLAEQMDRPEVRGQAYNFGTGEPLSVLDLMKRLLEVSGSALDPVVLNEAKGEIQHQYLSSSKARGQLGWRPAVSLRERLAETVDWYRQYFAKQAR